MNWHSASEFFDMGGYGLYVWGAYAVTAVLMLAEPWLVARRRERAASNPSFNMDRLIPKLAFVFSVPPIDWNTRSTGAFCSISFSVVVM